MNLCILRCVQGRTSKTCSRVSTTYSKHDSAAPLQSGFWIRRKKMVCSFLLCGLGAQGLDSLILFCLTARGCWLNTCWEKCFVCLQKTFKQPFSKSMFYCIQDSSAKLGWYIVGTEHTHTHTLMICMLHLVQTLDFILSFSSSIALLLGVGCLLVLCCLLYLGHYINYLGESDWQKKRRKKKVFSFQQQVSEVCA